MKWLLNALSSSIGKKFVMGITGLLLCGFLVVHLAGNFYLYAGADVYNTYAHNLHSLGPILLGAEVGLFLLFLAHIALAVITTRQNSVARRRGYKMTQSKRDNRTVAFAPESWMFISGSIVLFFILVHLADFRFELRQHLNYEGLTPFQKAVLLLKNPITAGVYLVGCGFLGAHLLHGFASAFQSLGINHPKYNKAIKCVGGIFAAVIALGFASFVIWAFMIELPKVS